MSPRRHVVAPPGQRRVQSAEAPDGQLGRMGGGVMEFPPDHPCGRHGGPIFLGEELCPICACCSLSFMECENCAGDGVHGHDCGEDTCCCLDPEENIVCDICQGKGYFLRCLGGCDFDTKIRHQELKVLWP